MATEASTRVVEMIPPDGFQHVDVDVAGFAPEETFDAFGPEEGVRASLSFVTDAVDARAVAEVVRVAEDAVGRVEVVHLVWRRLEIDELAFGVAQQEVRRAHAVRRDDRL